MKPNSTQNHPKYLRIADYSYHLPEDRIAHFPKEKRDESKLLVYHNGNIEEDIYQNIAAHINEGSLMVFNQTKVVHVRLLFKKTTGSSIEVFCLEPDKRYPDMQTAMTQRAEVYWECLVGGANKWKDGTVLSIYIEALDCTLQAAIVHRGEGVFSLHFTWDKAELSFAHILQHAGKVPLPPYIHRDTNIADAERYQTIFAQAEGSVAAPTAGLHFTEHIFESLVQKKIEKTFLTLHVGAGTFKPVKSELIADHEMHAEWIEVNKAFIIQLLQHKTDVIAVGTTSMRTLESLYWIGLQLHNGVPIDFATVAVPQWLPYETHSELSRDQALQAILNWMNIHQMDKLVTRTKILIAPGYQCKIVNGLVTNFHQPGSTLLLLIAALLGDNWKQVYQYALEHDFRFLSYGDGCFIRL